MTRSDEPISRSMARRYEVQGNMVLLPRTEYDALVAGYEGNRITSYTDDMRALWKDLAAKDDSGSVRDHARHS